MAKNQFRTSKINFVNERVNVTVSLNELGDREAQTRGDIIDLKIIDILSKAQSEIINLLKNKGG